MKQKVILIAVLVVCVAILSAGTYAYYTEEATARNVITTGEVEILLREWQQTESGLVPYPTDPVAVMPGMTVSKIVTVTNQEAMAYARAKFEIRIVDAQGQPMEFTEEELAQYITFSGQSRTWVKKDQDDGWWYYPTALYQDQFTDPLFSEVTFSGTALDNRFQGSTIYIDVTAQAVQAANNSLSALTADGWPAE